MLYREIIAVCSQIQTKHINTLCGQKVELLNVKPVGTNSNHWALGNFEIAAVMIPLCNGHTNYSGFIRQIACMPSTNRRV